MTPRERILTMLSGGVPDFVPWFADLDYLATAMIARGERPRDFKDGPAYIDWHRDLRVGFYLQGYFPFRETTADCRITEHRRGNDRFREIRTPKGTLTERWTWMPESFSEAPVEWLVKSPADLPAYRFWLRDALFEPDYGPARRKAEWIGDQGVVLCYMPRTPLMRLIVQDAGIETVALMDADAPEELAATVEEARRCAEPAVRLAADCPAEVLMIPENLSSEVVGPGFFRRYVEPIQRSWAGVAARAGKKSCIHMDGTLRGLLGPECGVGLTFIEAMTPAPVGDLAVGAWPSYRQGSATIFWGGLPGTYFTPLVSDAEFDRHVAETLRVMREDRRMVLGAADQVPPDGLESRVRRVADLVEEHGRIG